MYKHLNQFCLQYISDIHLERRLKIPIIKPKANYLALLGDIGYPNSTLYNDFIKYTSINWDRVFLLQGQLVSSSMMCRELQKLNLTRKKKREHPTFYLLQGDKPYVLVWRLRNLPKIAAK